MAITATTAMIIGVCDRAALLAATGLAALFGCCLATGGGGSGTGVFGAGSGLMSACRKLWPHFGQNFAAGEQRCSHCGQHGPAAAAGSFRGLPQPRQKRAAGAFSAPHFVQAMSDSPFSSSGERHSKRPGWKLTFLVMHRPASSALAADSRVVSLCRSAKDDTPQDVFGTQLCGAKHDQGLFRLTFAG